MIKITNEVLAERIDNFRTHMVGELTEIKDHLKQLNSQVAKNTSFRHKAIGIISVLSLFWGLFVVLISRVLF